MANSLRSKLSKLRHDRNISEKMYHEFLDKLDGHDRELRNKVIDEFVHNVEKAIYDRILQNQSRIDFASGLAVANIMIEDVAEQMKGEEYVKTE